MWCDSNSAYIRPFPLRFLPLQIHIDISHPLNTHKVTLHQIKSPATGEPNRWPSKPVSNTCCKRPTTQTSKRMIQLQPIHTISSLRSFSVPSCSWQCTRGASTVWTESYQKTKRSIVQARREPTDSRRKQTTLEIRRLQTFPVPKISLQRWATRKSLAKA